MAEHNSLDRVQSPTVIAQPIAIGPRQAEHSKDNSRKGKKRRRQTRPSIEETRREEPPQCNGDGPEDQGHIDYRA
jgi:hypothetical protein